MLHFLSSVTYSFGPTEIRGYLQLMVYLLHWSATIQSHLINCSPFVQPEKIVNQCYQGVDTKPRRYSLGPSHTCQPCQGTRKKSDIQKHPGDNLLNSEHDEERSSANNEVLLIKTQYLQQCHEQFLSSCSLIDSKFQEMKKY